MCYYWFNKKEIWQKTKERYSKEKGVLFRKQKSNKEKVKGSKQKKKRETRLKSTKEKDISNLLSIKKKHTK